MKNKSIIRSHSSQIFALVGLIIVFAQTTAAKQKSDILVRRFSDSDPSDIAPKIFKLKQSGHKELVHVPEIVEEPLFTLKSDPVKVQSDFKTVDITVLNRLRDKENAKKVAIIQQDLQSRIKINKSETESETKFEVPVEEVTEPEVVDPNELIRKQAKVKEDIESRVLLDGRVFGFRQEKENNMKFHYPVKRSDDYYADESMSSLSKQPRMTTEAPKEQDTFFSIFESLFGSGDDESQTKKKSKPEDELMFKDPEDPTLKENIRTVGDILKPLKPVDEQTKPQNAYAGFQSDSPEYRIVNNFHSSQTHRQTYKPPDLKPSYHNFYKTTEKPFRPYRPPSTNGYEDYDLEEFMDKNEPTTRLKVTSDMTTTSLRKDSPTTQHSVTTIHPATTTVISTTIKTTNNNNNSNDNKLKFPSIQKKNDYINRNRYQEIKNEVTEKRIDKVTEKSVYEKPEIKSTTESQYHNRPNEYYETKLNEVKPQKIQENPNFYNLINLPVRYSTKDTAIPLISTSYANTKIQGMGAHKYEKGVNGKYPNHKYDQTSTTKKPNYWATKRTSTEKQTTSFKPFISKTTSEYVAGSDIGKIEYDEFVIGSGAEFGGYGNKMGVDIKVQEPIKQTSTASPQKETTKVADSIKLEMAGSQQTHVYAQTLDKGKVKIKEIEKISEKPFEKPTDAYEDYEYDTYPGHVQEVRPTNQNENYSSQPGFVNQVQKFESSSGYNKQYQNNGVNSVTSTTESSKLLEAQEYEYYDYETELSTTTSRITTTTPRYKIKYPSLSKDKIKTSTSEKVAVVVPSKDHDIYYEGYSSSVSIRTTTPSITTSVSSSSTTTSSTTMEPKPPQTSVTVIKTNVPENSDQFKKPTTHYYQGSFNKEPAPVFEEVEESEEHTTKQVPLQTTKKLVVEKYTTTEPTVKTIVTSTNRDHEDNVNIVLVPTKETVKNSEAEKKYSQPELTRPLSPSPTPTPPPPPAPPLLSTVNVHKIPSKTHQSNYDYTTEFTVGAMHGHSGGKISSQVHSSLGQGHFVASSISTNPYGDDEPFRPIPKPPGMTSSFQVVHEDSQRHPTQNSPVFQKRPVPTPPSLEDSEPIHEPHEFIPSPQFHRPAESKPSGGIRPGSTDVDYDLEGIQTQPKPGQYVIFSKPQLNPEMNENQLKKKPEVSSPNKGFTTIPQFHEKVHQFGKESQKHVVFKPKESQFYQSSTKPKPTPTEKIEQNKPLYGNLPEINDDRLSLQLVPPRGTQTEKPFDGNFESEKQGSTVSYPRPHWEKNGKPSFLMNTLSNKNDMIGNRLPPVPLQMAPTLIPPSSMPPQRFRRPLQPLMPPLRKNFNEAGTNVKPKPNLPNILPQFRPNAKVGNGPYHRPQGYISSNRRNGMNRYNEKEHGNFPYLIQNPDKDTLIHREYEMGPEIIPKFITNRGKLPSDMWNSQGMQKRSGQGPVNVPTRSDQLMVSGQLEDQPKILRRLQRTPVTTLQMLKQMPGIKTQKTQISREDNADPSAPLVPPIYRNYVDLPKNEENLYIVYPAKAPQKLQPDDTKVFIVSDEKSQKNINNFTNFENQQNPLLYSNKRGNPFADKSKNDFPYGFIKPDDKVKLIRKEQKENVPNSIKVESEENQRPKSVISLPTAGVKDEKIDMNLHMQSNNQWNEVRSTPESVVSVRGSSEKFSEKNRNEYYRFSEYPQQKQIQKSQSHINPPSEYHTSIKDDSNSAFTLGAVMHTMSESSRKGQVASVSLHDDEKELNLPKLNVNERISNGKIVTVSMPLDVKQESDEESTSDKYQFQAPFQASSSISSNESHPTNSGWSIVKNPNENPDPEDEKKTTEEPSKAQFNFENFKPELIGGFKPIYELPEEPEEHKEQEKTVAGEEKGLDTR